MGRGHRRLRQVRRLCERRSARAQDRQHCEVAQTEEEWHRREQHEQQQQEQQELRQEDPVLIEFEELARQEVNRVFNMLFDYAASIFAMSRGAYMRVIRKYLKRIIKYLFEFFNFHL